MNNIIKLPLVIVSIILFASQPYVVTAQEEKVDEIAKLKWLETADAEFDAIKAIERKDFRLRAIYGYTLSIPGLDQNICTEYKTKFGFYPIEGTSDHFNNVEHARLNRLAIDYAFRYNEVILNYQKQKKL